MIDGKLQPIQVAEFSEADEGLMIVASASHKSPETEAFIAKYKNPKLKELGSSLKLLLVAEGEAHVYPRLAPTSEWDTCAAQAVVEAAGGTVVQHGAYVSERNGVPQYGPGTNGNKEFEQGKPVRYGKDNILNPYFVVYGKRKRRRRMAQREFSARRDSPVMVRLLQKIVDAQDD